MQPHCSGIDMSGRVQQLSNINSTPLYIQTIVRVHDGGTRIAIDMRAIPNPLVTRHVPHSSPAWAPSRLLWEHLSLPLRNDMKSESIRLQEMRNLYLFMFGIL